MCMYRDSGLRWGLILPSGGFKLPATGSLRAGRGTGGENPLERKLPQEGVAVLCWHYFSHSALSRLPPCYCRQGTWRGTLDLPRRKVSMAVKVDPQLTVSIPYVH